LSQYASNLGGSGGASSNLSVGPTGVVAPIYATEIGFISGVNLVGVSAANPLPITITSGLPNPLNVNIADFGGSPVTIGQQLSAASLPVVIASNQSAIPVSQSGTWNITNITGTISLPTGASTSALQTTGNTSLASILANQTNGTQIATNPSVSATGSAPPASATYAGASVTTAAPTYTTGQMSALSLTTAGALRVDGSGSTQPISGTVAVTQSTSPWIVAGGGTAGAPGAAVLTVQGVAGGTAQPVSGTVAATQSGAWNITNITGTVSLPTGAATSANLTTLGSQTTKINDGANTAAVKAASTAAVATDPALVVAISPNNTIKTAAPVNANGSFTGSLSVTTTEASTAAPANAVGVVFEAESTNATNIRWGVSNSSGAILSTSSGVLMEPGRSIDFLPIGAGTFLHYISTAAGSNVIDIQWVLSA
jgi:hypothetical protein